MDEANETWHERRLGVWKHVKGIENTVTPACDNSVTPCRDNTCQDLVFENMAKEFKILWPHFNNSVTPL